MTVSELIAELQKLPGDAVVEWTADEDDCLVCVRDDSGTYRTIEL